MPGGVMQLLRWNAEFSSTPWASCCGAMRCLKRVDAYPTKKGPPRLYNHPHSVHGGHLAPPTPILLIWDLQGYRYMYPKYWRVKWITAEAPKI